MRTPSGPSKAVEFQKGSEPNYNLFNLKAGQTAVIDDAYFQTSLRLCGDCVERLAQSASVDQTEAPFARLWAQRIS